MGFSDGPCTMHYSDALPTEETKNYAGNDFCCSVVTFTNLLMLIDYYMLKTTASVSTCILLSC